MKYIELTQGKRAIVDDEHFELLNQWKWHVSVRADGYDAYAIRIDYSQRPSKNIAMHRLIMGFPKKKVVDHIDNDGLNNQKSNLRICTHTQNKQNWIHRKPHSSIYKGVTWHKGTKMWYAQIRTT